MSEYNQIINEYQNKGLPYRDRNDDIRGIVSNLVRHIYSKKNLDEVICSYKLYPFIHDIFVKGNSCIIKYDCGEVSFDVFPENYYDRFCKDVFNLENTSGHCHGVSQSIIEVCSNIDSISAITSLCVNTNYLLFFHSYVYDKNANKILDFSRKFSMDKEQYDRLFCYKELTNLNYREFICRLVDSNYEKNGEGLFPLLYLAVNELEKNKVDSKELCGKFGNR